ncbi:hypothetical protein CLIB1423_16S01442 [[Candida] railenensis]|uniref:Uncharacterized protein n=1 Tax=[Candida] railenensis TaxID=45579 RepID=A0A9P0QSY8_9ASCO|nr:hypothetical protein CLIB1423_16S01442 [[Candida] railenensis]
MLPLLLSFPDEILVNILHFLAPDELENIFLLRNDPSLPKSYYQNLALYSKFYKSNTVVKDAPIHSARNASYLNHLTFKDLEYLVRHNIFIRPKEINFVVCGRLQNRGSLELDSNLTVQRAFPSYETVLKYSRYFRSLTTKFKVKILVTQAHQDGDTGHLDRYNNYKGENTSFMSFLRIFDSRINQLSIEYRFGRKEELQFTNFQSDIATAITDDSCVIDHLKLHMFDSAALVSNLQSNSCFVCNHLQSLDLSYNNMTDSDLSKIRFPTSITNVNLSNNLISSVRFELWDNLESLNLSNNHISDLSSLGTNTPLNIKHLNLACNDLKSNSIKSINNLNMLETLDLSRNLITYSVQITMPRLTKLNLSGNNLRHLFKHHIPSSVSELDISYCKVSENHERYKRRKLKVIVV